MTMRSIQLLQITRITCVSFDFDIEPEFENKVNANIYIHKGDKMKAVVTVIGKDEVGILASVSASCAEKNANVIEVTQSILDGYFCMIMLIDISKMTCQIDELQKALSAATPDMVVHVMHEDIFNSLHRI